MEIVQQTKAIQVALKSALISPMKLEIAFMPRTEAPHTDRRDLHNLKSMLPFLMEFRGRVIVALSFLILA